MIYFSKLSFSWLFLLYKVGFVFHKNNYLKIWTQLRKYEKERWWFMLFKFYFKIHKNFWVEVEIWNVNRLELVQSVNSYQISNWI